MREGGLIRMAHVLDRIADGIAWIGKISCWLLIPIILAVLLSVYGGLFRVTQFLDWESEIFLFASGVTLNSVVELQWYMFGIMLMLTGAYALHHKRHVRVDALSGKFSNRTNLIIEILGDLLLLLPLCILLIDRSLPLLEMSYRTGERSNEDGLTHRWVFKMFVPLGFGMLATLGVVQIARNILTLMGAPERKMETGRATHGG